MVKIKYLVRYFVEFYPYKDELSKTRLTKMVYLADWYNALKYGDQLTDIEWYFDHYGPYVVDVYDAVKDDQRLLIKDDLTAYGSPKQVVVLKESHFEFLFKSRLDESTVKILKQVIEDTKLLYWTDFIQYVYSTYPINSNHRYTKLNLSKLAIECKTKGFNL